VTAVTDTSTLIMPPVWDFMNAIVESRSVSHREGEFTDDDRPRLLGGHGRNTLQELLLVRVAAAQREQVCKEVEERPAVVARAKLLLRLLRGQALPIRCSQTAAIVAVIIAGAVGIWYYLNTQDEKASLDVSQAVRILQTPVRPANMPADPEAPSFASNKERAAAAQKKFQEVINLYPHTHAAEVSRYFVGITSADLGDNAAAENSLKEVVSSGGADLSGLAKMALASVYRNTNRIPQAVDLYKQLVDKPTATVPKTTAQLELASTYEAAGQPVEARRIYQEIQKDNPTGEAAQMASAKLQQLK